MDLKRVWDQATALVSQMTIEEQAAQLRYNAPAIDRLGIPAYNWWNEALHGVARAGTATVFPQAIGMAAMFDAPFLREIADTIATEGRAKYNLAVENGDRDIYKGLTFWSPNVNIFRDPRWGRGHETYGEDPYLTARLGVAFVTGLQGEGEHLKSAACAKHFAVHSGPEALRHEFDAIATPKDMRETYLPAFEALVREAGVEAVMGAYNRVNGEPACGSKTLLVDLLRGEWGFQGHVVSDCWAIRDFHAHHHVTDTAPESAALAIKNGCDINCGHTYLVLLQALQEGVITEEMITLAATRAMAARIKLGILAGGSAYDVIDPLENDTDANAAQAREAARRSMVLLKNDGILPLDLGKLTTVAVIGPNADSIPALEGNYMGTSSRYVTFLDGIRAACANKARVLYSTGSMLKRAKTEHLAVEDDRISEAVGIAKRADVVFLCVGLDATIEGEEGDDGNQYFSGDKESLELPESQRKLIEAVIRTGAKVVTVVSAGSALRIADGNAIIQAWYPGQAGGAALADIVFGMVSPSGRLPLTFYHSIDELPAFEDYNMAGRTYRYYGGEPLYPFGFGLSYAKFTYEGASIEDGLATVTVKNEGAVAADEVVQVYVKLDSPDAPPNPRLCGFARVRLSAGEAKQVRVALDKDTFFAIDQAGQKVSVAHGTLYIGGSQPDPVSLKLTGAMPLEVRV